MADTNRLLLSQLFETPAHVRSAAAAAAAATRGKGGRGLAACADLGELGGELGLFPRGLGGEANQGNTQKCVVRDKRPRAHWRAKENWTGSASQRPGIVLLIVGET